MDETNKHATEKWVKENYLDKDNIEIELGKKADKSDIANAYRFCGSAPTFEGLPFAYQLIPNGVPTKNGEVCGEYVEDEYIGVCVHFGINTTLNYGDEVIIPIKPITLKKGTYSGIMENEEIFGYDLRITIGDFCNKAGGYQQIEEQTIDYIKVDFPNFTEEPVNYPFYIEHIETKLAIVKKFSDSWFDEWYGWRIPNGAYDNGAVYNVIEDDMNYAWNGTEYDALGGSFYTKLIQANSSTVDIVPNNFYSLGTVSEDVVINLTEVDSSYADEYMFEFVSAVDNLSVTITGMNVLWQKSPIALLNGYKYQFSILNGVGLWTGVNTNA